MYWKNEETRLDAFETKGLREILRVSWTAEKTNECVLNKAGIKRELLDTVKAFPSEVKHSPYSITERRFPELIPVLGSQPAGDVSHKPGGSLPLLSARPAVTLATVKRAATSFAAW